MCDKNRLFFCRKHFSWNPLTSSVARIKRFAHWRASNVVLCAVELVGVDVIFICYIEQMLWSFWWTSIMSQKSKLSPRATCFTYGEARSPWHFSVYLVTLISSSILTTCQQGMYINQGFVDASKLFCSFVRQIALNVLVETPNSKWPKFKFFVAKPALRTVYEYYRFLYARTPLVSAYYLRKQQDRTLNFFLIWMETTKHFGDMLDFLFHVCCQWRYSIH